MRMIAGVGSSYLFPAEPILKRSYLEPVDTSTCFTGEIPQLVTYGKRDRYRRYASQIRKALVKVTSGDEAQAAMAQVKQCGDGDGGHTQGS
jgi:hypothetical protein